MNFPTDTVTGVVLAGGQSTRMGVDKAGLDVGNITFLESILQSMERIFERMLVVGRDDVEPLVKDDSILARVDAVRDLEPGLGPLGGLQTALYYTDTPLFLVGCDMPLVSAPCMRWIISEAEVERDDQSAGAAVVFNHGRIQPLLSIYNRNCEEFVDDALAEGCGALRSLLARMEYQRLDLPERFDRRVMNVNTPEEFEKLARAERAGNATRSGDVDASRSNGYPA